MAPNHVPRHSRQRANARGGQQSWRGLPSDASPHLPEPQEPLGRGPCAFLLPFKAVERTGCSSAPRWKTPASRCVGDGGSGWEGPSQVPGLELEDGPLDLPGLGGLRPPGRARGGGQSAQAPFSAGPLSAGPSQATVQAATGGSSGPSLGVAAWPLGSWSSLRLRPTAAQGLRAAGLAAPHCGDSSTLVAAHLLCRRPLWGPGQVTSRLRVSASRWL